MISLCKHNGFCNVLDDLSRKIYDPSATKDKCWIIYLIARISEAITLVKHISCHCKFRFSSTACNSNLKWNSDKKSKKYHTCKKDYIQNPSAGICENSSYLKSIVDKSVIVCDK